jgi:hypothetical protein
VFHTHNPLSAPPLNVRGYEKAGRCSFFNKVNLLLMIKRAQLIQKSCYTTGASKAPTGGNPPVVIYFKNALTKRVVKTQEQTCDSSELVSRYQAFTTFDGDS